MFKDATNIFSRADNTVATVIPAMDGIEDILSTGNDKYSASIKQALSIGKETLNKYYSKTEASELYRIAMGIYIDFYTRIGTNVEFQYYILGISYATSSGSIGSQSGLRQLQVLCVNAGRPPTRPSRSRQRRGLQM